MDVRHPVAAGQFYPLSATELRSSIEECFRHPLGPGRLPPNTSEKEKIFGAVVPHAGYMYSGPVAANAYYALSSLAKPDIVIISGPNHWGIGSSVSVFPEGVWKTPLGEIEVDGEAAKELAKFSMIADLDDSAHKQDHCLEVQLPFLQYIYGEGFKILPIIMALQDRSTSVEAGNAIAEVAKSRDALILASSDFTHYEPHRDAVAKDSELINTILTLDVSDYYRVLEKLNVSACGYGAIASVMTAVKKLGAKEGRLLKYATSGDVTGDKSAVVGYSSITFV
ncbi:MAG: MEMO1 family protein [Nitrososphaerales archaeon]